MRKSAHGPGKSEEKKGKDMTQYPTGRTRITDDNDVTLASVGSPLSVEQSIVNWIRNGQGYVATSGAVYYAGLLNNYVPFAIWIPATNPKNILIVSIQVAVQTGFGGFQKATIPTANPAYVTAVPVANIKPGGAASASGIAITYDNSAYAAVGAGAQDAPYTLSSTQTNELHGDSNSSSSWYCVSRERSGSLPMRRTKTGL